MDVLDSSAWLEFFENGPNAPIYRDLVGSGLLIVPTISIYEVSKIALRQRGQDEAELAVEVMTRGRVVDLDAHLALEAAKLSALNRLPMADSIILATARHFGATLWTQDVDFAGMDGVRYVARA